MTRMVNSAVSIRMSMVLVLLLLVSGCQTSPKVDWTTRVGEWNYDEVVKELGPADKKEELSDGSRVAEWIVQHGTTIPRYEVVGVYDNQFFPTYPYRGNDPYMRSRLYQGYRADVRFPDQSLRMIFRPDGTLDSVKRVSDE